jgi:uncharacterized membrane protein YdbT with pleckstrin-like domain
MNPNDSNGNNTCQINGGTGLTTGDPPVRYCLAYKQIYMIYSDNMIRRLSPSQWMNLPFFIAGVVGVQTVILPVLAIVKYIEYRCWKYEFNERTIIESKGILSVTHTELHYYRIKSIRVEEPFLLRLLGLSNVYITASDPYQPELKLYAVPAGSILRSQLREKTDTWRKSEGVKEFDLYNL